MIVTHTTTPSRPVLDVRYTLRLYRDLLTDINNEATRRRISVNEFFVNLAETHFSHQVAHSFNYAYELRPAWQRRQAERCLPSRPNG